MSAGSPVHNVPRQDSLILPSRNDTVQ